MDGSLLLTELVSRSKRFNGFRSLASCLFHHGSYCYVNCRGVSEANRVEFLGGEIKTLGKG